MTARFALYKDAYVIIDVKPVPGFADLSYSNKEPVSELATGFSRKEAYTATAE